MSVFYVIAAGLSYMDVTEEEWKFLEDKNTISFSRVPYGSRKFKYWFSIERDYIDASVLRYMAKIGNTDTKLLLYLPNSINLAKTLGFNNIRYVNKQTFYFMPSRSPWFVDEPNPPHKLKECTAKTFNQPIFRYRGQLIAVINACLILGATEIRLIGVDLNSQENFYDTPFLYKVCKDEDTIEEYNKHHILRHQSSIDELKRKSKGYDPSNSHSTNIPLTEPDRWGDRQLRGVADVIQWIDSEMREEGMEGIFITNKTSLLYKENKLRYRDII